MKGWALMPEVPTDEMLSLALAHLAYEGHWRADARPIGTFISGYTAAESEAYCQRAYGKERMRAAYAAMLAVARAVTVEGK